MKSDGFPWPSRDLHGVGGAPGDFANSEGIDGLREPDWTCGDVSWLGAAEDSMVEGGTRELSPLHAKVLGFLGDGTLESQPISPESRLTIDPADAGVDPMLTEILDDASPVPEFQEPQPPCDRDATPRGCIEGSGLDNSSINQETLRGLWSQEPTRELCDTDGIDAEQAAAPWELKTLRRPMESERRPWLESVLDTTMGQSLLADVQRVLNDSGRSGADTEAVDAWDTPNGGQRPWLGSALGSTMAQDLLSDAQCALNGVQDERDGAETRAGLPLELATLRRGQWCATEVDGFASDCRAPSASSSAPASASVPIELATLRREQLSEAGVGGSAAGNTSVAHSTTPPPARAQAVSASTPSMQLPPRYRGQPLAISAGDAVPAITSLAATGPVTSAVTPAAVRIEPYRLSSDDMVTGSWAGGSSIAAAAAALPPRVPMPPPPLHASTSTNASYAAQSAVAQSPPAVPPPLRASASPIVSYAAPYTAAQSPTPPSASSLAESTPQTNQRRGGVEVFVDSPYADQLKPQRHPRRQRPNSVGPCGPTGIPLPPARQGLDRAMPLARGSSMASAAAYTKPAAPTAAPASSAGQPERSGARATGGLGNIEPRDSFDGASNASGGTNGGRPSSGAGTNVRGPPRRSSSSGPSAAARMRAGNAPRPSASLGCGVQSNRKLIRNAIERYCLKGEPNRVQRELMLRAFDDELNGDERFVILFKNIQTGRHDIRALYACRNHQWVRVLQMQSSPAALDDQMVAQCLRYDSGGKEFKAVPALQTLDVADAVFLQPQFLPKSRVVA